MDRRPLLVFAAVLVAPCASWPQGDPLGPEFRVNTYTTGNQGRPLFSNEHPSVSSDSSGNFVVVWSSAQDAYYGVFGQRYDASGVPRGPEFRVNTYTTDRQFHPSVASDASGNFVVVWHSRLQDGSGLGVFGQRYASSGVPLGPEFRVNTYTTGLQGSPSVAADSSGNFVVVWHQPAGLSGYGILGQRFAASGAALGPEFRVNTYTQAPQGSPSVASDAVGNFVVVWSGAATGGLNPKAFGQRYAASGSPLGAEFRVNTTAPGYQLGPAVASDASGNFVVVWFSNDPFTQGIPEDAWGQRYASTGAPLGTEFRVNTTTLPEPNRTSVAMDSAGDFVVVWESAHDGSSSGVFGQRFANTGAPLGPEFRVNTYTTDTQYLAGVASDATGKFVVVWCSVGQDGSDHGVFGQRYSMIVPVELTRFTVE